MRKSARTRRRRKSRKFSGHRSTKISPWVKLRTLLSLAVAVFLFSTILWLGWEVTRSIYSGARWASQDRFNFFLFTPQEQLSSDQNVFFVSISSKEDIFVVQLPADQSLPVWQQFGRFRIGAIPEVYRLSSLPETYFTSQMAWQTGLVAQTVLKADETIDYPLTTKAGLIRFFAPTSWWSRRRQVSLSTQIKIWRRLQTLRSSQVHNMSAEMVEFLGKDNDQKNIAELNFLSNVSNTRTGKSVAVVNVTAVNGLGNTLANILTVAGFRVAHVSSDNITNPSSSKIYYSSVDKVSLQDLHALANFFPNPPEMIEDDQVTQRYRTSLVVVFGKDFEDFSPEEVLSY